MATVYTEITEHNRFRDGVDRGSGLYGVGYDGAPLVIRYKFKTPSDGALKITIEKKSFLGSNIGSNEKIMFFISPDEGSHINACYVEGASVNPQYDGIFTISDQPDDKTMGYEMATGSVEKLLLPSTDYYLFFFPAFNTFGYYDVYGADYITITLEGSAGLVRIGDDVIAQPYIHDGTEWKVSLPYLNENENWKICG